MAPILKTGSAQETLFKEVADLELQVREISTQVARSIVDANDLERDIRTLIGQFSALALSIEPLKALPGSIDRIHRRFDGLAHDHQSLSERLRSLESAESSLRDHLLALRVVERDFQAHLASTRKDHELADRAMTGSKILYRVAIWAFIVLLFFSGNAQMIGPLLEKLLSP